MRYVQMSPVEAIRVTPITTEREIREFARDYRVPAWLLGSDGWWLVKLESGAVREVSVSDFSAHYRDITTSVLPIEGHCPMCAASLVRDLSGVILCSEANECPDPLAASEVLRDTELEHIVEIDRIGGYRVKHPIRERIADEILNCAIHEQLGVVRVEAGRYRAVPRSTDSDTAALHEAQFVLVRAE